MEESCRELNEDSQSDVALHLMNCFLEMSGHETYNCDQDKKHNLRAICINNMSDRAFMVYTEFYTQVINICWFLRGQVWNEMIAEHSMRLLDHIKLTNKNQETLLKSQEKSLHMQEKLLENEKHVEKFMSDFYLSAKKHQDVLDILLGSVTNLQNWLIGEISWFDSIVFYVVATFVVLILTATRRTNSARTIILCLLSANIFVERLIARRVASNSAQYASFLYKEYYAYVWYSRYFFIVLSIVMLCISAYRFKDYVVENHALLKKLYEKNNEIYEYVKELNRRDTKKMLCNDDLNESIYLKSNVNGFQLNGCSESLLEINNIDLNSPSPSKLHKENQNRIASRSTLHQPLKIDRDQYNLRKRQQTPEIVNKHFS